MAKQSQKKRSSTFKCGIAPSGLHLIYAPDGTPLFEYWFSQIGGRLGGKREYNLWLLGNGKAATKQIICMHQGLTRTVVRYLNTGVWRVFEKDDLEPEYWFTDSTGFQTLKDIREKYLEKV